MDISRSLPASSSSVTPTPSGGLFSGMVNAFRGARNTHDRIFSHGVLSKVFLRLNDKEKMMKTEVRLIFAGHVKKNDSGFRTLMYIAEKGVDLRKILPKKDEVIQQSLIDLSNDLGRYFFNSIMTPVKSLEFSLMHIAKPLKENGFIDAKMYDVLAEIIKLKKIKVNKDEQNQIIHDHINSKQAEYDQATAEFLAKISVNIPTRNRYPVNNEGGMRWTMGPDLKFTPKEHVTANLDILRLQLINLNEQVNSFLIKGTQTEKEVKFISYNLLKIFDLLNAIKNHYSAIFYTARENLKYKNFGSDNAHMQYQENEREFIDYNFKIYPPVLLNRNKMNFDGKELTLIELLKLKNTGINHSLVDSMVLTDDAIKKIYLLD